jgi:hypothetical protein
MNKLPSRPKNMNEIMSSVFNPAFETEFEKYKRTQDKITREIFGE